MPYPIERPTWSQSLEPIFRAFDGYDSESTKIEDLFDDDEPETKWRDDDGFYGGDEQDFPNKVSPQDVVKKIVLPKTASRADNIADQRAAARGVDPSRASGGVGNLIDLAKSQLGTPYVWGAEDPQRGFDCSGFIYWAYNRAGIKIPRLTAREYQNVFKYVPKDELQPGDVVYYSYGRLGRGVVDHIEIYMGDGKQIGTSNVREDLDIDPVDYDHLVGGGRIAGAASAEAVIPDAGAPKARQKVVTKPVLNETSTVPAALAGGEADFTSVLGAVMAPDATTQFLKTVRGADAQNIPGGVKGQLAAGFRSMGRDDLARMVNTKAFDTWINQESGWRADATSPANNHGLANDGYFQIWRGHDFNSNGQVAKMSPYEQARLVAKYFSHLTPAKIREYARSINAGNYHGWG